MGEMPWCNFKKSYYEITYLGKHLLNDIAWCKLQNNRVRVIENEVPNEIFPPQFRGSVYDIKVQGKKRAPDDQLYSDHEDLR